MHKYVEYLEKIAGDREKEKELVEIISEALERIKKHCPDEFYGAMYKIHCLICGPHFDDRLAEKAVSHMKMSMVLMVSTGAWSKQILLLPSMISKKRLTSIM